MPDEESVAFRCVEGNGRKEGEKKKKRDAV
jgi:hypothetical protein